MIIPVKCFTCGKVLGDKYLYYIKNVKKLKVQKKMDENQVLYLTETTTKKTPEGIVMDDLGLNKICCRRHFLTHVDII
jgi:DNA-directed RNA polymerase subunit N (RpoN/RPB10)